MPLRFIEKLDITRVSYVIHYLSSKKLLYTWMTLAQMATSISSGYSLGDELMLLLNLFNFGFSD